MIAAKIPAIMSWSSGKDSAYALHKIMEEGLYDVRYLVSTIDGNTKKIAIHEVPEALLEKQAELIGIPLKKCYLFGKDNQSYENSLQAILSGMKEEGIFHIIFGDLVLEDLRSYREEQMKALGMACVFPLWQMDSTSLVEDFVAKGFQSIICSVNETYLPNTWVGKLINDQFLKSLPADVDPCGENGEYHSFCLDGPIFKRAVDYTTGAIVSKSFELNQTGEDCTSASSLIFWCMEIMPKPVSRQLICARCNDSFACNSSDITNCQCNAIPITKEMQDLLQTTYEDCLCASCLRELAAGK